MFSAVLSYGYNNAWPYFKLLTAPPAISQETTYNIVASLKKCTMILLTYPIVVIFYDN